MFDATRLMKPIFKSLTGLFLVVASLTLQAQGDRYPVPALTHHMTPEEAQNKHLLGISFAETDPPPGAIFSLGEFERSKAVLVRYPFGIPVSLIREMARDAEVITLVSGVSQENTVRNQYTQAGVNLANCSFIHAPTESYWTRDYGPWFIAFGDAQVGIVDFPYNRPRPNDDDIPVKVATAMGLPLFGMNVIHTGGNYMTDGYGTAASTLIAYTENPGQTPTQVDQKMQAYLGINNYHVVEDPNNTYIDHIDCWGKYLAPHKLLLRSVPPSHPQYDELEATAAYFASITTPWGVPYKIYRVNTPQNEPYTNSFILNDKVFVPIMGSQNDAAALEVYRQAMPGYKVFGIMGQTGTPWESTDALHCRTHEIADPGMLRIRHIPFLANQNPAATLGFSANVTAYSGADVISDSVILYYRFNPNPYSPFESIKMSPTMGGNWSASLETPEYGSTVQYYIHAADASGRSENHPFIGKPDPHEFYIGQQLFATAAVSPDLIAVTAMKDLTSTETLTIGNQGAISLNYFITVKTGVTDTIPLSLPNSPMANAYQYNTFTENGWTTATVNEEGVMDEVFISYNWTTDNYPSEGSLWAESPSGMQVMIASGQSNGNYTMSTRAFAGEDASGVWKFWIEDTYGDGGHQAKNISAGLVRTVPSGNWLSAGQPEGSVAPGAQQEIELTFDATNMEPGIYPGTVIILSNDPGQPELEVPVKFTVTINTGVTYGISKTAGLHVYPNPGTGNFTLIISGTDGQKADIFITDLTGRLLYRTTTADTSINLNLEHLPSGIYLLKVISGNASGEIKLMKQ